MSSNLDDLSEKFREHIKVHLDQELKDDHRKRSAKSRAMQRKVNNQKLLDDQNKWKTKSRSNQREVDNQKLLDDQNKFHIEAARSGQPKGA